MSTRISRHDSRIIALSALFSYHLTGKAPDQVFEETLAFYPRFSRPEVSSSNHPPAQPLELRAGTAGTVPRETETYKGEHAEKRSSRTEEVQSGARREGGSLCSYISYARNLFFAAVENLKTLDELIESRAEGWTVSRMPVVDRCILELALAELLYAGDAPTEVVLDEAVNLAKEFGTADSPAFINGLLAGVVREKISPA